MSEERDIEKKLRAAAEQRKAEAGGKFELHPASRRVLQGEVVRTHEAKVSPRRGLRLWLVWAGSAAAVVVAVGLLLLPQSKSGKPMRMVKAPQKAGYTQMAAAPAPETKRMVVLTETVAEPAAPMVAAAPVVNSSVAVAADMPPAAQAIAQAVPDATRAPAKDDTLAREPEVFAARARMDVDRKFADEQALALADDKKFKQEKAEQETLDLVTKKAAQPATAVTSDAYAFTQKAQSQSRSYANNAPARMNRTRASAVEDKLLNNFNLEQSGDVIRIVDGDGSVYTGNLLAETRPEPDSLGLKLKKDTAKNVAEVSQAKAAAPGLKPAAIPLAGATGGVQSWAAAGPPLPEGIRFSASGTNLTLRQQVFFRGAIVVVTNGTPGMSMAANFISDNKLQTNFQNNLRANPNRLVGRAVTADGQSVEVDAEEVLLK